MGYQQGLSGLAGAANHLDVIGNNIANANTVGYKQGRANFADMYANSVATSTNTQIGIGTRLTSVQQQFGQGTINTTKSSLDIAINGNGFFQMSNNGVTTYSRDGVFHRDKSGAIVDAQNRNLMGYAAGPGGAINTAATVPLQAPTTNIAPQATTKITGQFNLNSQDKVPAKTPFNAGDNTTYNYNSSIQVYDTLGGSQQVSMYFAKNAAGTLGLRGRAGPDADESRHRHVRRIGPDQLDDVGRNRPADAEPRPVRVLDPQCVGRRQSAKPDARPDRHDAVRREKRREQPRTGWLRERHADDVLDRHRRQAHRQLLERPERGARPDRARELQQPERAENIGGNQYVETTASGVPQISAPGSTNHGTLQGSALENSNVNLTTELVNLIKAQRDYQANAQTIKTQQAVDQTLLNMR